MTENEPKDVYISPFIQQIAGEVNLPQQVYIFDTTLRDGEQTPGVALTIDEKLQIAQALDELGVDVIEAGMPIVSPGEQEAVKKIQQLGLNAEIAGLARTRTSDLDALQDCEVDVAHVFIATSDLHLQYKLRMNQKQVHEEIVNSIIYAKELGFKGIEYSAEDATRTDLEFLVKAYTTAVSAGADRINIPDTVGTITPHAYGILTKRLTEAVRAINNSVRISLHCHNDFGLATANTLAGIEVGANQVHVCVNGIGERAGNASLEEVVMSLYALYGIPTNIKLKQLYKTSKLVERLTKVPISPCQPFIGDNTFRHESGIHAHAALAHPRTYEPITPELIGKRKDSEIATKGVVIGKHSGAHSIQEKLKAFGIDATREQTAEILSRIKEIGDKGKRVTDFHLITIAESIVGKMAEPVLDLKELIVVTGLNITPSATVKLRIKQDGSFIEKVASDIGVGPVDAACNALQSAFKDIVKEIGEIKLESFAMEAIEANTDAFATVHIRVSSDQGFVADASASKEDIVVASIEALVNGYNRLLYLRR
ncbi:MAG: 2-isopropylmalate synthase [Promethearchaeota archaeon]